MPGKLKSYMSGAIGALAPTTLGGCYYGDVYGASYASRGDCAARYGNSYYDYDGYAYDDGYGYDCYDASDYGGGSSISGSAVAGTTIIIIQAMACGCSTDIATVTRCAITI